MGGPKESKESKIQRERDRRIAEKGQSNSAMESSRSETADFRRAFMRTNPNLTAGSYAYEGVKKGRAMQPPNLNNFIRDAVLKSALGNNR